MASTNPTLVIDNAWEGQGFFSFGFPWSDSKWAPSPNLLQTFFSNTNPKIATNENQILRIDITVGNFNKNHNDSVELLSKQLTESGFNPVINYVDRRTYANHWQQAISKYWQALLSHNPLPTDTYCQCYIVMGNGTLLNTKTTHWTPCWRNKQLNTTQMPEQPSFK